MKRRTAKAAAILSVLTSLLLALPAPAFAAPSRQAAGDPGDPEGFSAGELVDSGHKFFGTVSRGVALTMQEAIRRWGQPTGYILGQEASGAIIGGLRYGEGVLYTRRQAKRRIYWQGPSVGFDFGGEGARTMMLVYNMQGVSDLQKRFIELDGSAYFIAGFGLTAARADDVVVVPIRSGVGLRLGVNLGYLKFSDAPTWNPF
jgi:hypothetical protein